MAINIEGFTFSGPYYHTKKFVNDFPCVYILVNSQGHVIDVGETESINSRILYHERKTCWIRYGCGNTGLYVYISEDKNFRQLLERLIRLKYNPPCGEK